MIAQAIVSICAFMIALHVLDRIGQSASDDALTTKSHEPHSYFDLDQNRWRMLKVAKKRRRFHHDKSDTPQLLSHPLSWWTAARWDCNFDQDQCADRLVEAV
jgi:hypothetical protein